MTLPIFKSRYSKKHHYWASAHYKTIKNVVIAAFIQTILYSYVSAFKMLKCRHQGLLFKSQVISLSHWKILVGWKLFKSHSNKTNVMVFVFLDIMNWTWVLLFPREDTKTRDFFLKYVYFCINWGNQFSVQISKIGTQ